MGLLDHPGERRKIHRVAVPHVGGLALFAGLLVGLALAGEGGWWSAPMLGAWLLVIVGTLDDQLQLGPRLRLLAQAGAALLLTLGGGVTLDSLGNLLGFGNIQLGIFAVPFTVFAMVGIINAFNMIDGIDGLAGGLALLALGCVLLIAPPQGHLLTVMLCIMGALIPFLLCNLELPGGRRCKVFLGDAGSLLLGYVVVWALVSATQTPSGAGGAGIEAVTALWLVAIPLMDTLAVMLRRISLGRHPFEADQGHLHHLLSRYFNDQRPALMLILAAAAAMAGMGLIGNVVNVNTPTLFYGALALFATYLLLLRNAARLYRRTRYRPRPVAPKI
ncbi:undecaprenyl-phosphate alpha-N-acetylglucosaminyl 1-phosphate transferase [Thiohalocapsa marina]|uniref:Undecaprenyl-phosphate alpha-N-acetylglucosaminyl 1-phosphate transferase n=1 Tax=Thiohalocapsa marina TaxID=424902 RepID=A0A5M8FD82_9GAMM|nr:undecaprenyl-phosphate alpha-N-acetylglucosaminyl 1-phosphate transferase [Thiohalocapsa marina]